MANGFAVILLGVNYCSGLILPGPCPSKPSTYQPSEIPSNSSWEYHILFIVPFAYDTPKSYLFVPIPLKDVCYTILATHSSLEMKYTAMQFDDKDENAVVKSAIVMESDSLDLRSSILEADNSSRICHEPILEKVRIWVHESVALLWQCHELGNDELRHDEALIVALRLEVGGKNSYDLFAMDVDTGKHKNDIESYTGAELIEKIQWSKVNLQKKTCTAHSQPYYSCPTAYSKVYPIVFLISSIVIAFCAVWLIGEKLWKWHSNRVIYLH